METKTWNDGNAIITFDASCDDVTVKLDHYTVVIGVETPVSGYPGGYTYTDDKEVNVSTDWWGGADDIVKMIGAEDLFNADDTEEEYNAKFVSLMDNEDNRAKVYDALAGKELESKGEDY